MVGTKIPLGEIRTLDGLILSNLGLEYRSPRPIEKIRRNSEEDIEINKEEKQPWLSDTSCVYKINLIKLGIGSQTAYKRRQQRTEVY